MREMECETSPLPGPSSAVAPTSCAASIASLTSTGSNIDKAAKHAEMVATLQARRAQLEAKLAAKNEELKMLCIQEAELTGVLPPEIPLEPGETPPTLRRRVGTSFTLPENLLNKLRSTEEESVPGVELEIKIQSGIAEAALGLANDNSASKQVRRKHRLMFQQSQRRLQELETKLNTLREKQENQGSRPNTPSFAQPQQPTHQQQQQEHQQQLYQQQLQQQQLKHRKKPRPPVDNEQDVAEVDGMLHAGGISLSPLGQLDRDPRENRHSSALTASSNTVGLPLQPTSQRYSTYRYSTIDSSWSVDADRFSRKDGGSSYWGSSGRPEAQSPSGSRYNTSSRYPSSAQVEIEDVRPASQRWKRDRVMVGMSRFGSLDRRRVNGNAVGVNASTSAVSNIDETETGVPALLPSQTYPEHSLGHSLVRTQSLGSVEASRPRQIHVDPESPRDGCHTMDRRTKEKEWYETSLDVAPVLSPSASHDPHQHSHPPLQQSLSQPPPQSHLHQSHPQLHHTMTSHHPPTLPLSQSHSHLPLPLPQTPTVPHPHSALSSQNHETHGSIHGSSSHLPQSQSQPQLHSQVPPPHLHPKLSATHSTSHLSVYIPPYKPMPLPPPHHAPPSHSYSHASPQPPAIPPHASAVPPAPAPPLPPHSSSHSPAQVARSHPHPPPLPPPHSSVHHAPPQLPPHASHAPTAATHTPHVSHSNLHSHAQALHTPPQVPPHGPPQIPPHSSHQSGHQPPALNSPASHPPPSPQSDDTSVTSPHVPLESPKNHMVVQAGSWQPYREVTKPFEMSDFYKYSTKFRKQMQPPPQNPPAPLSPDSGPQSPQQHKGVYQPLQPLTCKPIEPQTPVRQGVGGAVDATLVSPPGNSESLADAFSNEMLAWFQDQRGAGAGAGAPPPPPSGPPPRSATLV